MTEKNIYIKGARVNNLKNVDVEIPRNRLVVVTGLSGSGKSSLAFDTLYAEGQRRYVESLSAYARQFMGKMAKPEVDFIKGLPPAIAIEQKVNTRNPRSTVGTSTEIYDYMRLLFGRVGKTYSPVSGEMVRKHSVDDVVNAALAYPEGTRIAVAAPITLPEGRTLPAQLDIYMKEGFSRLVDREGRFASIEEVMADTDASAGEWMLLVDRLAVHHEGDELSRLADSVETAFFEGHEECVLVVWADGGVKGLPFSKRFEADGITFMEPNDLMFNFNNPYGACPTCEGFGKVIGIDENGRINLSIKKAMDPPPRPAGQGRPMGRPGGHNGGGFRGKPAPAEPASFEDRLKQFMAASDSKLSELRQSERRSSRRGGRK